MALDTEKGCLAEINNITINLNGDNEEIDQYEEDLIIQQLSCIFTLFDDGQIAA